MGAGRQRRGSTLATTVVTLGLALLLGLALSQASISHLAQSRSATAGARADAAAEAALAEATERLLRDPEFGIGRLSDESVAMELTEAGAKLTFNLEQAEDWKLPYSTNNRYGIEPIEGWGTTVVPPFSVQLVARGNCSGRQTTLESIIQLPEFPYVVASSGVVESDGALTIGVVDSIQAALDLDSLGPTALAAVGDVSLRGTAAINGSIESAGEIQLSSGVEVFGEVRPFSSPVEMSEIDVDSLRPNASVPFTPTPSPNLAGSHHHNGPNLTITGGLTLDNGVLFVNGDLTILGGISGRGAVIANGRLTVDGSSTLVADDQVALVAERDLTIRGQSGGSSYFQGLVYTEGDFSASDVTLVGAFVANAGGRGSRVQLEDAGLLRYDEYSKFNLDTVPFLVWGQNGLNSQGGTETLYLLEVDARDLPILQNFGQLGTSNDPEPLFDVIRGRKATTQDGRIISEWEAMVPDELHHSLLFTQSTGNPRLGILDHEVGADHPIWRVVQASLHIDLNQFLGTQSRLRVSSWRRV